MGEAVFDIYRVRYGTYVFGSITAIVSGETLRGVESLLIKKLGETMPEKAKEFKTYSIEKTGFKSDKEGVLLLGIDNK